MQCIWPSATVKQNQTRFTNRKKLEARVEKVEDVQSIMAYGVMPPALVIDEQVKSMERIPINLL
ncbi:MAG: thioredoxin family protein [Clostridia bacterium]|nr:thioredoxin family protein [Clostridia bacterium]